MEHIDQDINQLLLKCIEGIASDVEMKEALDWINKSDSNRIYFENMRDIWLSVSAHKPLKQTDLDSFWQKFYEKNFSKSTGLKETKIFATKKLLSGFIKVAAIILITLIIGIFIGKIYWGNKKTTALSKEFYVIEAPRGAKSFLTLTDGTKIWLNAGSKISYQRNYNQDNRKIYLVGEAFFEVAKNKEIPFLVYSSGIVVRAIGTAFNVKAYPEEGIVETTLVEGSVSIESIGKSGKKEQTFMQPHQKANFYKVTKEVVIEPEVRKEPDVDKAPLPLKAKIERIEVKRNVDTELYTSWKDKRWVFEKQRLEDFAVVLERIYDIKIVFKDDELKNYKLSGSFQEENLDQVFKAIQYTIPLDYSINHNEVVIKINPKLKNKYQRILKK